MIEIPDTGVSLALQAALGHGSPFTAEELATVVQLRVQGASDLTGLEHCRELRSLSLIASDVSSFADIAELDHLATLHVLACPIEDASALAGHATLVDLQIDFTFLQDLAPLLELPALRQGRLIGNPLHPTSWTELRPRWQRTLRAGSPRAPVIEFGRKQAWEATRLLWDRQIRLCFGELDGLRPVLVRPGISRIERGSVEASRASLDEVRSHARGGSSTDQMMEAIAAFWDRRGEPRPVDFASHRTFGDRIDAESWIAAAPDADKEHFRRFIRRFPTMTFYREDSALLAATSASAGAEIPPRLAASRAVLAGALADEQPQFRLASFADASPRADSLSQIWYSPRLGIYAGRERQQRQRDQARMFTFAEWLDTGHSFLAGAISSDSADIYEFNDRDLYDAQCDKRPLTSSIYRVFGSYADMLAHIDAFKLPDGTLVSALRDEELSAESGS